MRHVALFAVLLAACVTQDNYPDKLGVAYCRMLQKCDPAEMDALAGYPDEPDDCNPLVDSNCEIRPATYPICRDNMANAYDAIGEDAVERGCTFDEEAAAACLDVIWDARASCDTTAPDAEDAPCRVVYRCPDPV